MSRLRDVPIITQVVLGEGSPEGRIRGPVGWLYIDAIEGRLYIKQTKTMLTTGWMPLAISGGVGVTIGNVDPEGAVTANEGSFYYNRTQGTFWFKASGNGNTGWE